MPASLRRATALWERVWTSWPFFIVVLAFWVLGLISGTNLHGFIHILLLAATMQLVKRIAERGRRQTGTDSGPAR